MPRPVLIVSHPDDIHAFAVAEALRRKGASVVLWHTSDFPSVATETVSFDSSGAMTIDLPAIRSGADLTEFATVWYRRPEYVLDTEALDPRDVEYAHLQCRAFRTGLFDLAFPDAFWVNPRAAANAANNKMLQHLVACRAGFRTPATLYSNSPSRIRTFLREHGGGIVFKPLLPIYWRQEDVGWITFTALIREDDLVDDDLLLNTPGIYQEHVPKDHELRITMMGSTAVGVKLHSQQTSKGLLDWRRSYPELRGETVPVPEELRERCNRVLSDLGLVFGCFDIIVSPEGEWYFLEVNQMGQFLFLETMTGAPLLDAFTDFLIAGDPRFLWEAGENRVPYDEIAPKAEQLILESREDHVLPVARYSLETPEKGVSGSS